MIVCVCHRVSDRKINQLLDEGYSSRAILKELSMGDCCGQCVPVVKAMEREQQQRAAVVRYLPAFSTP
ncbi:MAG: (2Fe-2S)-binding protein [Cardiobacteriaceae bacterium]|nr:(2Fe-2S)-binding protein [Cardiobacteriaceae bacterium]